MSSLSAASKRWDHPRRCGENPPCQCPLKAERGSPPQVRGKLQLLYNSAQTPGITPAGAGKTSPPPVQQGFAWDHPRRCGENSVKKGEKAVSKGSPPQVRGKHFANFRLHLGTGITPAGAGKTGFTEVTGDDAKDHPRRCGENAPARSSNSPTQGSPPQVRGKPAGAA